MAKPLPLWMVTMLVLVVLLAGSSLPAGDHGGRDTLIAKKEKDRQKALEEKEEALEAWEKALKAKEKELEKREEALKKREAGLKSRKSGRIKGTDHGAGSGPAQPGEGVAGFGPKAVPATGGRHPQAGAPSGPLKRPYPAPAGK